jgi:hypothetical protein
VCSKPTLPWHLAVCPIFESILEAVVSQRDVENCKIDKSGSISSGNTNVDVKVKDGGGQRKRLKRLDDDDDADIVAEEPAGQQAMPGGGSGGMQVDGEESQEQKMDILRKSGLWEYRQDAEDQFCEPINVLAAQASVFSDDDNDLASSAGDPNVSTGSSVDTGERHARAGGVVSAREQRAQESERQKSRKCVCFRVYVRVPG